MKNELVAKLINEAKEKHGRLVINHEFSRKTDKMMYTNMQGEIVLVLNVSRLTGLPTKAVTTPTRYSYTEYDFVNMQKIVVTKIYLEEMK